MENENLIVKVSLLVSNVPRDMESKNTVKIYLNELIIEIVEDESGMVMDIESFESPFAPNPHIQLHPRSLRPRHLSQLLRDQQVPYSEYIGQQINAGIVHSLANDDSLRQPVFVTVDVKFIEVTRFIFAHVGGSAPRGASGDVLRRLVEEQRVNSTDLEEDETCSICIENLSENIIRLPQCLHMFHQGCLFEWLGRNNSCPLCRRVPYED